MAHGVHKHGKGYRGVVTLSTPTYKTEAEAEAALADLRASIQRWRSAQDQPAPAQPRTLDRRTFIPSCDYPRP